MSHHQLANFAVKKLFQDILTLMSGAVAAIKKNSGLFSITLCYTTTDVIIMKS
jgi:hypothetical protein